VRFGVLLALTISSAPWAGPIRLADNTGAPVQLGAPAQRLIALSPHATELVFAAGAGELLVGTVAFSDFPREAKRIRRVGDAARIDREAILALEPDLVVAWPSGNRSRDLAWIESLGIPLYRSDPAHLTDIPRTIRDLGALCATEREAERQADAFERRLRALRAKTPAATRVPVFYQLWSRPLMTVGSDPLLDELLGLCGAENIFGHLPIPAPQIDPEAVLAADPQGIVASITSDQDDPFGPWRRWRRLAAIRHQRLLAIPADLLHRPSPRILDGAARLCAGIEAWPPAPLR